MLDLVPAQGIIESIADRIAERLRPAVPVPVDLHSQVEVYLAEGGRRNAATTTEVRRTLDWFLSCCDSQGLPYDSRQGAVAFKKYLTARGIEARTLNFHLGRVSQFLRWAVAHGYVEAEPVSGVKIAGGTGKAAHEERDAIDPAVLGTFLTTNHPRHEPKAWLPWLLAYSGARLNEIASLYLDNVKQLDGVWVIEIGDRLLGQSIKNAQSRRMVPIHSALLSYGLLNHVASMRMEGHERLFPMWSIRRPGKSAAQWARLMGLNNLHGIRHGCLTQLVNAGVAEDMVKRIAGHQSFRSMLGRYSKGREIAVLRDAIEHLEYD